MQITILSGHVQAPPQIGAPPLVEFSAWQQANGHAYSAAEILAFQNRLQRGQPVWLGGGAQARFTLMPLGIKPQPGDYRDALIAQLLAALKISAAAFHTLPKPDQLLHPGARTACAAALVAIQAAVGKAEGRPFDMQGTDLLQILEGARDVLVRLLPDTDRLDKRELERTALAALGGIVRMIGPGHYPATPWVREMLTDLADEQRLEAFAQRMSGEG